jgi:hypothetical protein
MPKPSNRSTRRLATLLVAALLLAPLFDLHSHAADQDTSPTDVYQECAICVLLASAATDDVLPAQPFVDALAGGKVPAPACVPSVSCKRPVHASYLSRAPPITLH